MSAAAPRLAAVIPIDSRRPARRVTLRSVLKVAGLSAICLLGLIGSIADSLMAQNELGIAATVAGAILGNVAVCVGVALLLYWYLSRPTAEILELRPRRLTKR